MPEVCDSFKSVGAVIDKLCIVPNSFSLAAEHCIQEIHNFGFFFFLVWHYIISSYNILGVLGFSVLISFWFLLECTHIKYLQSLTYSL